MAELDYVSVKEAYGDAPAAVGNGSTDDTVAIQKHMDNLYNGNDGRALYFPWGKYRITSTIVVRDRIRLIGQGRGRQLSDQGGLTKPAVLWLSHTGSGIEIRGQFVHVENLVFQGTAATGDAIAGIDVMEATSGFTGGHGSRIEHCNFLRQGGKAAVRIRLGGGIFANNFIAAHQKPVAQWSYNTNAGVLAPVRGHALWCSALVDHEVCGNQMASEGSGLHMESCGGMNVHDNFIFNSNVGVHLAGVSRSSIADNRVEEHCRHGMALDWNCNGNTITGNRFHNSGARIALPANERVGLILRSGEGNVIVGNAFDNWDHNVQQEGGALDFRSPQQYGVRTQPVGTPSAARPAPQYNLIGSNTFRQQKTASILNEGDATNKFRDNVARDFPDGVLASYQAPAPAASEPQVHTAALGLGSLAAGLIAFRNRRQRSR